ncbi:MAG: ornithine carbamoyltransferase [Candidatus Omnitrophica bacterium]|nr:ornithine carbamoyltransferase [Candidatus Omnitrophota bacterium]MBU1808417.1 ornithine carbamoyltransferase [Candidatus Omnitrophota bacterium]
MKKDLLSVQDLGPQEIFELINLAEDIKVNPDKYQDALKGKSIGLIFQKPSTRTRVSFEIGMFQMGGHSIYLGSSEIGMGGRESVKDVACVLSRYLNGIVARTYKHEVVEELAKYSSIPIINGLSDVAHPCQALGDMFTIEEKFGTLERITISYIGDGNNVLNSLMCLASKLGINMKVATPKNYSPDKDIVKLAKSFAAKSGSKLDISNDPKWAAKDSDVLYTDVWVSMGQEKEAAKRIREFKSFQLNDKLVKLAKKTHAVMHCLPAHRGQEISDSVMDSRHSIVYAQAENRMHIQKAILLKLLK